MSGCVDGLEDVKMGIGIRQWQSKAECSRGQRSASIVC